MGTLSTSVNLSIKLNIKDNVFPRDVKSTLCLLVNLFLEQPKIKDEDSNISDSLMKLIKTSAVNEGLHANSFGKVISFVMRFI